jgi:hypothetical protein
MKLIEKMALDFCGCTPDIIHDQDDPGSCRDFLEGFRAAREMALEVHMNCPAAGGCCEDKIKNIGEEEV